MSKTRVINSKTFVINLDTRPEAGILGIASKISLSRIVLESRIFGIVLKGHGFSRAAKTIKSGRALASEGWSSTDIRDHLRVSRAALKFAVMLALAFITASIAYAAPRKSHSVTLGAARHVPYSRAGDPAGAATDETTLKIRPLIVDTVLKEWTTGDAHDVTDRSFVVRRVLRINDTLPSDQSPKNVARVANTWVWQRGPWLMVDRVSGHVSALKLPDYDPGVSQVSWFRDYGAYCGLTASGKSLYAVVAQLAARRPILAKKLDAFNPAAHQDPVCAPPDWQREPLKITFHPTGKDPVSFDIVPGSALLVEDTADDTEAPAAAASAPAN